MDIHISERVEQPTAGIRENVPMTELTSFFARAFHDTMGALQAQGMFPTGPPFGKYYGMPAETIDVEAGFPVATAIAPAGNVRPGTLPGGRCVEAIHVGPYDTMKQTYAEVERYVADAGLTPSAVVWESYLSDPQVEPDPSSWRTLICWPVA